MNKKLEIAVAALERIACGDMGGNVNVSRGPTAAEFAREALAAIRAASMEPRCKICNDTGVDHRSGKCHCAPVETLADDAGCQAVVAKALYTYVRDPLVHTLLSDLDAYRAGKQR